MTGGNGAGGAYQYYSVGALTYTANGMTVGIGATLLTVLVSLGDSITATPAPTCTWNGVSMTLVSSWNTTSPGSGAAIFTLVNPASGNYPIVVTVANNYWQCYISAISWKGTETVTGFKSADNVTSTSGAVNNPSVTVATESTGATLVLVGIDQSSTSITASNQTQIFSGGDLVCNAAASYALGGTPNNMHSFTAINVVEAAWAGIHIIAPTVATSSGLLLGTNQGGF